MAGITRFIITDEIKGRGAHRFKWSRERHKPAVELYRSIYTSLNMPLEPGYEEIRCTKDEFQAGYDYELGIDVILRFTNGMQSTLQEKFLTWREDTVTVEYMNDPRNNIPGDWFTMKAQLYFVGYDRTESYTFTPWILLDWQRLMQCTIQNRVPWILQNPRNDGARANFKFVYFNRIPEECIILRDPASMPKPKPATEPRVVSPKMQPSAPPRFTQQDLWADTDIL